MQFSGWEMKETIKRLKTVQKGVERKMKLSCKWARPAQVPAQKCGLIILVIESQVAVGSTNTDL